MRISDIHSGLHAFVPDGARQGLDIHTIVEGVGSEGVAHGVERHVLASGAFKDPGKSLSARGRLSRNVLFLHG